MRRRRNPEIIVGRGTTQGAITSGDGFTLTASGTGIVVVTIIAPGFRLLAATASVVNVSAAQLVLDQVGSTSFVVRAFVAAGSPPVDVTFSFIAVGVQQ
jgi:hypothetical protein